MSSRCRTVVLAVWSLAALLGGCASQKPQTVAMPRPTSSETSSTDPCAMQLHDLCGAFLLFYLQNRRLPEQLDELKGQPGLAGTDWRRCPQSELAYVYNPAGLPSPKRNGLIILYDATPVHSGTRWAIEVQQQDDKSAIVAKVIALPESFFTARPLPSSP